MITEQPEWFLEGVSENHNETRRNTKDNFPYPGEKLPYSHSQDAVTLNSSLSPLSGNELVDYVP